MRGRDLVTDFQRSFVNDTQIREALAPSVEQLLITSKLRLKKHLLSWLQI